MQNNKIVSASVLVASVASLVLTSAVSAKVTKTPGKNITNGPVRTTVTPLNVKNNKPLPTVQSRKLKDDLHVFGTVTAVGANSVTVEYADRVLATSTKGLSLKNLPTKTVSLDFSAFNARMSTLAKKSSKSTADSSFSVGDKVSVFAVSADGGSTYTLKTIHKMHAPSKINAKMNLQKPSGKSFGGKK